MAHAPGLLRQLALLFFLVTAIEAAEDGLVLSSIFPGGGRAGTTVEVELGGVENPSDLTISLPGVTVTKNGDKKFGLAIPANAPPGAYDVYALTSNGLSSPRIFTVSQRPETVETEPNNEIREAVDRPLSLDTDGALGIVVNGRLASKGDFDCHAFSAKKDQVVIVECWAERIESQLQALVELYDSTGRRLHVPRHRLGLDPLLEFRVPADGIYVAKVHDLTHTSGGEHFYRLVLDTGPRVCFAHPCVVQQGQAGRVALYGWNLDKVAGGTETLNGEKTVSFETLASMAKARSGYEQVHVDIPPHDGMTGASLPFRLRSTQIAVNGFTYHHPQSNTPTLISLTDVPVVIDGQENHTPELAQHVEFPCEIAGQLTTGGEQDWFAIRARRGEVVWFEGFGERIDSPIDLDITVLDANGERELANFADERRNDGDRRFPTDHSDPSGRWVVPADGRFLFLVRNVAGTLDADPRRVYRVSVRREEPDIRLALVSRSGQPAAINVPAGGRRVLEVIATRQRGATESIQITALDVPAGLECPDVWIPPGAIRAPLVVSTTREASPGLSGLLRLVGRTRLGAKEITRPVAGGTMVRAGLPLGVGRLTNEIPVGVAGNVPLQITASYHQTATVLAESPRVYPIPRLSQGSVISLAVDVDWLEPGLVGDIRLTGLGLPESVGNQVSTIPKGADRGYISFYLPPHVAPGRYTVMLAGEAAIQNVSKGSQSDHAIYSNPVFFEVYTAPMLVEIDPNAPRKIRRGETVQVAFTARRQNGFIGKIHIEMVAPGGVIGLRGRGTSFVSQTDSGKIQIVANDDAPLGLEKFLRFEAAGYVEDEILYLGSCFVDLEVVE